MIAIPGLRAFSLSEVQNHACVTCNQNGVFVGCIPLLKKADGFWKPRSIAELNNELTNCYRLPVDIASKVDALALIASALNRGDFALAAIATVHMQIPDPPARALKMDDEFRRRALALYYSGFLKAGWDPAKHPRTGTKPNPGWFALVPKKPEVPGTGPTGPKVSRSGWPQTHVNKEARAFIRSISRLITRSAGKFFLLGIELNPWIEGFLLGYTPVELNQGEDRLVAQLKAALQPFPTSLEELQKSPAEDVLGYELHHIVGQNDANLAKDTLAKFAAIELMIRAMLFGFRDFLHEQVSAEYSSDSDGAGTPLMRDVINKMDFAQQREEGLKILRKLGILK